jgi:hypothetical protein
MSDNKYNGWSNYATWRVNLEILGDMDLATPISHDKTWRPDVDYLKDVVEEVVFGYDDERKQDLLKDSYANAFLSEVNYHEILQHMLEEIELELENI